MEKYIKTIKKRMWACIIAAIGLCATALLDIFGVISPNGKGNWFDFWSGMRFGIFAGFTAIFIAFTIKCIRALKNKEKLKKMYIDENDERAIQVTSKMSINSYWFETFGLILGVIIGGYFNMYISLTCLGYLVYLCIIRVALYTYYDKKY